MLIETKNETLMLSDRAYSYGKKLVQLVMPTIAALYFEMGHIWDFPAVEQVIGIIAIVSALIGVLLNISSKNFNASGAAYDGHVTVTHTEAGTNVKLNLDPHDLIHKEAITLKVNPPVLPDS